jgi:ribosomal protein L32
MSEKAVVCNAGDQEWTLVRTYGVYRIPPAQSGAKVATVEVGDRIDVIDMGDNRRLELPIHARKIAEDLTADLGDFGVFVAAGREPTREEIDAAEARLSEVAKRLVFEGDQEWARSHNYRLISDLHRRAVKQLGLEREWAYEPAPMIECPVCGERVRPHVAICKSCGAILDRAKAAEFGLSVAPGPAAGPRKPKPARNSA